MPDRTVLRRRQARLVSLLIGVWLSLGAAATVHAADIFVVETTLRHADGQQVSPVFVVSPGEDAPLQLDGPPPVRVVLTLAPGAADADTDTSDGSPPADGSAAAQFSGPFELRMVLRSGGERYADTARVALRERQRMMLGPWDVELFVRRQD